MDNAYLTKKQLRRQIKLMLTTLTDFEKHLESKKVLEKITHIIASSPHINTVASYAAMPSELNLDSLHTQIPETNFCYPKCDDNGQMEFHIVNDLLEMKVSDYGIREPCEDIHRRVKPESIDLFLCPAYAYTKEGQRLGKGGGYYDRYLLNKHPDAATLGVVFPCQILPNIPTEEHDQLIDRIL